MNEDNRDFFLDEARELIETLESSLLTLEKTPDATFAIHDIFRILHTIKGSGAMFGFDAVSRFAHQLENLFDDIRKGLIPANQETINIGLRSVDCFAKLIGDAESVPECDVILDDIFRIRRSKHEATRERAETERQPTNAFRNRIDISIQPDPFALFRGIKFEALFSKLAAHGKYECKADASRIPDIDVINPEEVYLSWRITLATNETRETIEQDFIFVRECADCRITGTEEAEQKIDRAESASDETIPELDEEAKPAQATAQQITSAAQPSPKAHKSDTGYIRVRREKLDFLVNTVGELVILQSQLTREAKSAGTQTFRNIAEQLERISATLRDTTMYMRMVPIEEAFSGLQRVVHDTARRLGKDVRLDIIGANTEIDKNVIESLKDPLIHLIRNSIDHGIEMPKIRNDRKKPETGTITISACQIGTSVQIVIGDDGDGLNIDKIRAKAIEKKMIDPTESDTGKIIQLIFEPGFSTADKTTSLSGRGVGMDIVRSNIDKLQGDIAIATERGKGTTFTLTVPLTLMITDGILVSAGETAYVLTLNLVQECLLFDNCVRDGMVQHDSINYHEKTYPIVDLGQYISGTPNAIGPESRAILTSIEGNDVAIVVERITGKQQVVIKPFTTNLDQIPFVSGATILADGSVALILNMSELIKRRIPAYCDF